MKPVHQRTKERNEKERRKVEVIEEYLDVGKYAGATVKVLKSIEVPYHSLPVKFECD